MGCMHRFDAILIVSGDGLIVEALNGLMKRDDRELALRMPLGVRLPIVTQQLHDAIIACCVLRAPLSAVRLRLCPSACRSTSDRRACIGLARVCVRVRSCACVIHYA